jgi:hypothetical protein
MNDLLPPCTPADDANLKASIAAHGVLDEVHKDYAGRILDGHRRVRIAGALGLKHYPVKVVDTRGWSAERVRHYILTLNCQRRQLTTRQRRDIVAAELRRNPDQSNHWTGHHRRCRHQDRHRRTPAARRSFGNSKPDEAPGQRRQMRAIPVDLYAELVEAYCTSLRTLRALQERTVRMRYRALFALASVVQSGDEARQDEAEKLYQQFLRDFDGRNAGDDVEKQLRHDAVRALEEIRIRGIGKPVAEIEGEDTDGKPMRLSDFKGKVVLLDFWAFW